MLATSNGLGEIQEGGFASIMRYEHILFISHFLLLDEPSVLECHSPMTVEVDEVRTGSSESGQPPVRTLK